MHSGVIWKKIVFGIWSVICTFVTIQWWNLPKLYVTVWKTYFLLHILYEQHIFQFLSFFFQFRILRKCLLLWVVEIEEWEQCYQEAILVRWSRDLGCKLLSGWNRQTLSVCIRCVQSNVFSGTIILLHRDFTSASDIIKVRFVGQ